MKPTFIPEGARPPVNQQLAREAWEVAAALEEMARQRSSGAAGKETSNETPSERDR